MKKGLFYLATTKDYINEVKTSVDTFREHNEKIPVALATSAELAQEDLSDEYFDHVVAVDTPSVEVQSPSKPNTETSTVYPTSFNLDKTPFEYTLSLDPDTYITGNIMDIFDLLENFDIACPHAPNRQIIEREDIPTCFPEYNSGVICFKKSDRFSEFLDRWSNLYLKQLTEEGYPNQNVSSEHIRLNDQIPFREALFHSDLKIATLPSEYHFRGLIAQANDDVKIIHMRNKDVPNLAEKINERSGYRSYFTQQKKLIYYDGEVVNIGLPYLESVVTSATVKGVLRRFGLLDPARRLYDTIVR